MEILKDKVQNQETQKSITYDKAAKIYDVRKNEQPHEKNKTVPLYYTIHKNELKVYQRLKCKT